MTYRKEYLSRIEAWPSTGELVLKLILIVIFGYLFVFISNKLLPDYLAYEILYRNDVASYSYNAFMSFILGLFKCLGIGYEGFRFTVLFSGIVTFAMFAKAPVDGGRFSKNYFLFYLCFSLLALTFIFEFYEIRLRAGISCLMFALAFMPEVKGDHKSTSVTLRLGQAILLTGSLTLHSSTFAAIFLFCVPPLVLVKYAPDWAKRLTGLFAIALALLWFGLLYQVVSVAPDRGRDLYSTLNPVRFFALVAVPMALFVVFDLPASRADRMFCKGVNLFPLFFSINYLICATVLAGFFFAAKLDLAGEAIVRIMTLSSLPAIFIIMRWGVGYARIVPTYLLICNGLFFINTVYL